MAQIVKETIAPQRFTELDELSITLKLGNFSSKLLGWGYYKPVWWRNHMHTHSFYEACFVYQGRGIFHIDEKDYQVEAGQVFVARPGKPHEIISSEENPLGIYFWSYSLIPGEDVQLDARGVDALLANFTGGFAYVGTPTPTMLHLLQMLTEEIVRKEPGYILVINGLLGKLLLDTARAVVETPALAEVTGLSDRSRSKSQVQNLVRFLGDNYNRSLTLQQIASQVNLSERQVSRLFKDQLGKTVMDYLNSLRLDLASQLLMEHKLSIKEIAETTGFKDVRYFMTSFRKHTGQTPGAYRNTNGTEFLS